MGIEVTGRDNISKDTEKYKEISSKSADIPKDLHFITLLNGCNRFSRKKNIFFYCRDKPTHEEVLEPVPSHT